MCLQDTINLAELLLFATLCLHKALLTSSLHCCLELNNTFLTCPVLSLQSSLLTFLFAGHDTSASTLMVATRFLKQHPEALTKLRAEQAKVRLAARVWA